MMIVGETEENRFGTEGASPKKTLGYKLSGKKTAIGRTSGESCKATKGELFCMKHFKRMIS
jgi:hypothetical protein